VRRLTSSSLASQFARPTPSCQVQPAFDVDGHLLTSSERETGSTRSGARKPVADWDVRNIRFIVTDWPERDRRHGDGGYGLGLCVALRETTLGVLIGCGATEGEAILLGAGSG
jgi:hypothetical protein